MIHSRCSQVRRRSHGKVSLVILATLAAGCSEATWEPIGTQEEALAYVEDGDSGDLPANAQKLNGSGSLTEIVGALADDDDVDMYALCLDGGGTFSALSTGALEESQLFLFDAEGRGVYFSDDVSGSNYQSFLPANDPLTPTEPGVYYLAISSFNNDPSSLGGEIFPNEPYTVVHAPTGPGGGDPVSSWSQVGDESEATYGIEITGASFCESNAPPDCSAAVATPSVLYAGHGFAKIQIHGVTDSDGDPTTITINGIFQDEAVYGLLDPGPDGKGVGTSTARVRKQARLLGNGRVYHIAFTAEDGNGGECEGEVTVGVKPSSTSTAPADDGPTHDSTAERCAY
jgi:hypothetical protein